MTRLSLSPTLRQFFQQKPYEHAKILLVGDVILDRTWHGAIERITPESQTPVLRLQSISNAAGGAAHVATCIAALKRHVSLIGLVGSDEESRCLKQVLTSKQIKHNLITVEHRPTITKHRIRDNEHMIVRVDSEQSFLDCTQARQKLRALFEEQLLDAQLLVLSDYNKGTLIDATWMIQQARDKNIPILVDPKGKDFSRYQGATLIKPNWREFESVVGHCQNHQEVEQKSRQLMDQHNIHAILVSKGSQGCTLVKRGEPARHYPAHITSVKDVTGAGDSMLAVVACAFTCKIPLNEAVELANYAASIAVSRYGTEPVSLEDLKPTVVFTNGCFDILHAGHIQFLQAAKALGNYLIVGLNTDESISRLKGISRPINSLNNRIQVLSALNCVDEIIPFSEDTPERLIREIQPDILTKGGDYSNPQELPGAQFVESYGGIVKILDFYENLSTTNLISKITQATA